MFFSETIQKLREKFLNSAEPTPSLEEIQAQQKKEESLLKAKNTDWDKLFSENLELAVKTALELNYTQVIFDKWDTFIQNKDLAKSSIVAKAIVESPNMFSNSEENIALQKQVQSNLQKQFSLYFSDPMLFAEDAPAWMKSRYKEYSLEEANLIHQNHQVLAKYAVLLNNKNAQNPDADWINFVQPLKESINNNYVKAKELAQSFGMAEVLIANPEFTGKTNYLWYSGEYENFRTNAASDSSYSENYGKLENGKLVRYNIATDTPEAPTNVSDAKLVGEGVYFSSSYPAQQYRKYIRPDVSELEERLASKTENKSSSKPKV